MLEIQLVWIEISCAITTSADKSTLRELHCMLFVRFNLIINDRSAKLKQRAYVAAFYRLYIFNDLNKHYFTNIFMLPLIKI